MVKYKKAPGTKALTLHVGNGDKTIRDHDVLEGPSWKKYADMGLLVRVDDEPAQEPAQEPAESVATPVATQVTAGAGDGSGVEEDGKSDGSESTEDEDKPSDSDGDKKPEVNGEPDGDESKPNEGSVTRSQAHKMGGRGRRTSTKKNS